MPSTSVATHQTTKAINDLLNAMQQTLGALGNTFDVLGEQTLSVATLGPAVDAVIKVSSAFLRAICSGISPNVSSD